MIPESISLQDNFPTKQAPSTFYMEHSRKRLKQLDNYYTRYAVVTGANKGIGFQICHQLAAQGVHVVLTARNEKFGIEAFEKLKTMNNNNSHHLLFFHQLDVADPVSISALADYLKNQFGKIDILVNNAGVAGSYVDEEDAAKIKATCATKGLGDALEVWRNVATQSVELTNECLQINYYGAKRMCEAVIPLLNLSDSPTIVNVSSRSGKLENIPNEEIKQILRDENLVEERLEKILDVFLKDFEEGNLENKGWPKDYAAYIISKAALNAYTRILANKLPNFCINCVCPGPVKTDITFNIDLLTPEEAAVTPVKLALLPSHGPTGLFFLDGQPTSL